MTKKELLKELEQYGDDSVVVCISEDGAWDNTEKVEPFGSNIAIVFGGGSPFSDER